MKPSFLTDLTSMRRIMAQQLLACLFAGLVISWAMGTAAPVPAVFVSMVTVLFVFNAAAYDDLNGWLAFRMSTPVSRRGFVAGRYASILATSLASLAIGIVAAYLLSWLASAISPAAPLFTAEHEAFWGSAVMGFSFAMVLAALTLPLVMRMGLTRGARLMPLAYTVLLFGVGWLFGFIGDSGPLAPLASETLGQLAGIGFWQTLGLAGIGFWQTLGLAGVGSLLAYAFSMLASMKLYEAREF